MFDTASNKYLKILFINNIFWTLTVSITACSITNQTLISTKQKGSYEVKQIKRRSSNSKAIILGSINDSRSKKHFAQLAMVLINNQAIYADSTGHYEQEVEQATYKITARNIFYNNLVTKHINIKKGDSLIINFYLLGSPTIN